MVNNYPEYAAGVNYKKTDGSGNRHFYSAQVVADPATETVESKLIKDGVVIDEGGAEVEALNVTENGTYSEEGKAFSPVVVNVESNFSTAVMTITTSGGEGSYFYALPHITENGISNENIVLSAAEPVEVIVPLFNGKLTIYDDFNPSFTSLDGDITLSGSNYVITGNCTVNYEPV